MAIVPWSLRQDLLLQVSLPGGDGEERIAQRLLKGPAWGRRGVRAGAPGAEPPTTLSPGLTYQPGPGALALPLKAVWEPCWCNRERRPHHVSVSISPPFPYTKTADYVKNHREKE